MGVVDPQSLGALGVIAAVIGPLAFMLTQRYIEGRGAFANETRIAHEIKDGVITAVVSELERTRADLVRTSSERDQWRARALECEGIAAHPGAPQ